jgi:hypothetical protein
VLLFYITGVCVFCKGTDLVVSYLHNFRRIVSDMFLMFEALVFVQCRENVMFKSRSV